MMKLENETNAFISKASQLRGVGAINCKLAGQDGAVIGCFEAAQ